MAFHKGFPEVQPSLFSDQPPSPAIPSFPFFTNPPSFSDQPPSPALGAFMAQSDGIAEPSFGPFDLDVNFCEPIAGNGNPFADSEHAELQARPTGGTFPKRKTSASGSWTGIKKAKVVQRSSKDTKVVIAALHADLRRLQEEIQRKDQEIKQLLGTLSRLADVLCS
ncbi:hypothetical protein EWM64_g4134 [Hericium alpestre]|uniref:Uncharacterized protein n=1 Tax=Hericium alpestre TaxID=135208 RepID=A0A4Z0A0D0_9AGAM|nr:hypothetical protein EWM64_g4134 [Hericium alpestre]